MSREMRLEASLPKNVMSRIHDASGRGNRIFISYLIIMWRVRSLGSESPESVPGFRVWFRAAEQRFHEYFDMPPIVTVGRTPCASNNLLMRQEMGCLYRES